MEGMDRTLFESGTSIKRRSNGKRIRIDTRNCMEFYLNFETIENRFRSISFFVMKKEFGERQFENIW